MTATPRIRDQFTIIKVPSRETRDPHPACKTRQFKVLNRQLLQDHTLCLEDLLADPLEETLHQAYIITTLELRKGDILASKTSNNPWVLLTSDLPGYIPPVSYWVIRAKKPKCKDFLKQLPPSVLALYPVVHGRLWEQSLIGYHFTEVANTPIVPCIAEDVENVRGLFISFDKLRASRRKQQALYDQMHKAIASRLVKGQVISETPAA
jgi:hypothetical protein